MSKTYITTAVLVLVVLGGVSLMFNGKKLEAPTVATNSDYKASEMEKMNTTDNSQKVSTSVTATLTTTSSPVKEFTITAKNFSFSPATIKVKKGDKVKITFENSEGFHDFVIDEFGAATKQVKAPATEVLEFTADKVGSFEYYCSVGSHRSMGMFGTFIVE